MRSPIITHRSDTGGDLSVFSKIIATSTKLEYTIYRNHHYKYEIKNLPNQIEIFYSITHWNVVNKQLYMGYGFAVESRQMTASAHSSHDSDNFTPTRLR